MLQVLATDVAHSSPSVLLFFDKERYLFNAAEGIQRLFREHRLKINKAGTAKAGRPGGGGSGRDGSWPAALHAYPSSYT